MGPTPSPLPLPPPSACASILHLDHKLEPLASVPTGFVCKGSLQARWPATDLSDVPATLVDSGLCAHLPRLMGAAKAKGSYWTRCLVGALGTLAQWAGRSSLDIDAVDAVVKPLPMPVSGCGIIACQPSH
jgi:hypothetical protein